MSATGLELDERLERLRDSIHDAAFRTGARPQETAALLERAGLCGACGGLGTASALPVPRIPSACRTCAGTGRKRVR